MIKEHYEKLYSETKNAFGGGKNEPTTFVTKLAEHLKSGTVLELGAGQGRNSLWLARQGLVVDALELSETGANDIRQNSEKEHLPVSVRSADVREGFEGEYDAVVSTYMTHHLTRDEMLKVIERMKAHTKPGGYNVLEAFTKDGDFFREKPATDKFYPELGELRSLYRDWEIVDYREQNSRARSTWPDGRPMFNIAASIIARRPS